MNWSRVRGLGLGEAASRRCPSRSSGGRHGPWDPRRGAPAVRRNACRSIPGSWRRLGGGGVAKLEGTVRLVPGGNPRQMVVSISAVKSSVHKPTPEPGPGALSGTATWRIGSCGQCGSTRTAPERTPTMSRRSRAPPHCGDVPLGSAMQRAARPISRRQNFTAVTERRYKSVKTQERCIEQQLGYPMPLPCQRPYARNPLDRLCREPVGTGRAPGYREAAQAQACCGAPGRRLCGDMPGRR
jgi:hypothetical protein